MTLHTGGAVKPDHADKLNAWLRNRAKTDKRAAKALRSIQQQIQQRELAQFEQHQSLLEQEMLGILRAGARDEATTTDEQSRSTVTIYNARFEQLFAAWRPVGAPYLPPNPDILDQVVTCYDTAVNACDIPNQSQVTQSQSPTTNHLSAQAHLCSLQRLHWRSCATVGQDSFRPNADANESGAKSVRLKRKPNKPNQINQQLQSWRPMRAS